MNEALLQPEEHVLSTLERDGSRRWLYPKLSKGRYWAARRALAYVLIAIFSIVPHIRVNGAPAILLDITRRKFYIFGLKFLPSDTLLLALFMVSVFVLIFLMTAMFGRVFCGWACPQTVYMEFLFRPIDRLFEGTTGKGGQPKQKLTGWRYALRAMIYLVLVMFLTHTLLAYFVGVEALKEWLLGSPFEHPIAFLVMAVTTGLLLFHWLFFREQLCMIACPYGRFQSVMLDRRSMIVAYDRRRGEPRGKGKRRGSAHDLSDRILGDCVDCHQCVAVCPTGIDIRNGLQMECVNCTQCMDVCDGVMQKVGLPTGLIRYASQDEIDGHRARGVRPRLILYPLVLMVIVSAFIVVLVNRQTFDALILRNFGAPFVVGADNVVTNTMRLKLTNRSEKPAEYQLKIVQPEGIQATFLEGDAMRLDAEQNHTFPIAFAIPREKIQGPLRVSLEVADNLGGKRNIYFTMLGPAQ